MPSVFGLTILMIFLIIAMLLLPCIIAAAFLEWGVSRWKGVAFNNHRYRTILILCIGFRLLLPPTYSGKFGTEYRRIVDIISGYSTY